MTQASPGETRPKVFVARLIPADGIDPIVAATDARVWEDELPPPRADLLAAIRGCDGVLTLLTDKVD
nr:D-glycerate dehydrogenase [Chloroflexota bacterium]